MRLSQRSRVRDGDASRPWTEACRERTSWPASGNCPASARIARFTAAMHLALSDPLERTWVIPEGAGLVNPVAWTACDLVSPVPGAWLRASAVEESGVKTRPEVDRVAVWP
jgi:hypothetical protein